MRVFAFRGGWVQGFPVMRKLCFWGFRWLASLAAAFILVACSPQETAGPGVPVDDEEEAEAAETEAEEDGESAAIEITADDNMRFGRTTFEVDPGEEVTVILENVGSMPKESMGHNFVLLVMGTDKNAFSNDAIPHAGNAYIPPGREDEVIAATGILGPGEKEELTFTAPEIAGEYDYVCSFPGHTAAGMVGVMTVRGEPEEAGEEPGDPDPEETDEEEETEDEAKTGEADETDAGADDPDADG